jgi:peptide/nickel transport system permease protein
MTVSDTLASSEPLAALASARRLPRWRLGAGAWIALAILGLLFLVAVFGPLLVRTDPDSIDLSYSNVGAIPGHLLGFDSQGRDLFARLVYGAHSTLLGPCIVIAASTLLGATMALASAWRGGMFDATVARVTDAMFAFPGLLLAILAVSLFGPGLLVASIALAIAYTPYVARIVRSAALKERSLPYIAALQVQGFSGWRIVCRHVLPNIGVTVIAVATLSFGYSLIDLAALSFIGLGVQPPQSDWGVMVANGVPSIIDGYPQESLFAGALIVIVIGAVNFLGGTIGDLAEAS